MNTLSPQQLEILCNICNNANSTPREITIAGNHIVGAVALICAAAVVVYAIKKIDERL
jgi:hypothetical protein